MGIGFAIPSRIAGYVLEQLITKGEVIRGFLGFVPHNLSPADKTHYNVKSGVLVAAVSENSPAAQAGLHVEDIVVRYEGRSMENELDLREAIARTGPGTQAALTVVRGGQERTLMATVERAPTAASVR